MSTIASANVQHSDADLVLASRAGDRGAFGQIVRRYQAMISGLVYAACGDLHRSEDIAQDTFISAWKSLSGLRDASKLPGWLCQIARRRMADSARKTSANEVPFGQAFSSGQEPAAPIAEPLSADECEFLWRTLAGIPQPYRETLVLFYRQEQSTAQVAAAMETSEASVRQRLTRGRQMLREELASQLERQLARSAPSSRFTMQVVAALPAVVAQAAGASATAKGAAAVKGGGLIAILLGWVVPLGIVFGMVFGAVQDVRLAQSPRQRRLAKLQGVAMFALFAAWVIAFNYLVAVEKKQTWPISSIVFAQSLSVCIFMMSIFAFTAFGRWQMERILREDRITEPPFPTLALWQRLVFTFPVAGILLGWMIRLARKSGDDTGVEIIAAAIVIESLYYAWRLPHLQPTKPIQQTFEVFIQALVIVVIMLNWRLPMWIADETVPLWSINLFAGVLLVWMTALWAWDRRGRSGHAAANSSRAMASN